MLTLPAAVKILLATGPVDMRKSIDGLMALVRTGWGEDVYSSYLFAFFSRMLNRPEDRSAGLTGGGGTASTSLG